MGWIRIKELCLTALWIPPYNLIHFCIYIFLQNTSSVIKACQTEANYFAPIDKACFTCNKIFILDGCLSLLKASQTEENYFSPIDKACFTCNKIFLLEGCLSLLKASQTEENYFSPIDKACFTGGLIEPSPFSATCWVSFHLPFGWTASSTPGTRSSNFRWKTRWWSTRTS
jgi:hypothetical protein